MRSPGHSLLLGVFLISAASLGLEVLAIRLVSILFYPVATYLVISLALLGIGVSGGALTLRWAARPPTARAAAWNAIGFSLATIVALLLVWSASSMGAWAILLPIGLALPFYFGGYALAVALSLKATDVHRIYFADLLGGAAGVTGAFLALPILGGVQTGIALAALGLASAAAFLWKGRAGILLSTAAVVVGGIALALRVPSNIIPVAPKELALFARGSQDMRWDYQSWGPLSRVDVLSLPDDRLETASGIEYKLVTQDGGAPSLLLHFPSEDEAQRFFDRAIFGLPYWIKADPSVLIIGLGGGPDVQAALARGARNVVGVEISASMIHMVREDFSAFTGNPYGDPRVQIILGDGRHVLQRSRDHYDIIQLTGVDSSAAALGANPNLAENYLYTLEAFGTFYDHLTPDGVLAVSFPNVEGLGLRLVGLASGALRQRGIDDVQDHIVVVLIEGFVGVLVKRSPLTPDELVTLRDHLEAGATSVYFPLYHRLFGSPPLSFFADRTLLAGPGVADGSDYATLFAEVNSGRGADFLESRPQASYPPSDDRPFFFVLDKWGHRSVNLQILSVTLGLLSFAGLVLILLPIGRVGWRGLTARGALPMVVYFYALGLGFIFIEVNYVQKLGLLLGHPSYSLLVTLGTMLVSSSLGSWASGTWKMNDLSKVVRATTIVVGLTVVMAVVLDHLIPSLLSLPLSLRGLVAVALTGVPGFFMGVPFPTAMSALKRQSSIFVPWAWGINAVASVSATVLALLIAMSWGFRVVFLLSAVLYGLAQWMFRVSPFATSDLEPVNEIH